MPVNFEIEEHKNEERTTDERPNIGSVPMYRENSTRRSVILTPEKKLTALMLKAMIFLDEASNSGVATMVYLVAIAGYTPLAAFIIRLIGDLVKTIIKPFIADVVDRVEIHKYTILVVASLLKIATGVCMVTTTNFGVMCLKFIMDGFYGASFDPAVTAMTLGVVGKSRFHKKVVAQNHMLKCVGQAIGTMIFGFVSYAVWPNVAHVYWTLVGGGFLMLLCNFLMFKESADTDAVDHRTARGLSVRNIGSGLRKSVSQSGLVQRLGAIEIESDDEEDDEKEELTKMRESIRQIQTDGAEAAEQGGEANSGGHTQLMTYRQMYADPKRRRSLIFLSLVLFTYHFANAPTAPLLGQYMAIESGRAGLPIATGLVLTNQLSNLVTTWALSNDRASNIGYRACLLIGSGALCLRLALLTIFINYFVNDWALGATQILDGIGSGCLGLMLVLYSHLLSRRTGHFNLNMGIVQTWKNLGGIVGQLLAGAIATEKSYSLAFPILCAVSVLPVLFSFGVSTPDLKRLD